MIKVAVKLFTLKKSWAISALQVAQHFKLCGIEMQKPNPIYWIALRINLTALEFLNYSLDFSIIDLSDVFATILYD